MYEKGKANSEKNSTRCVHIFAPGWMYLYKSVLTAYVN